MSGGEANNQLRVFYLAKIKRKNKMKRCKLCDRPGNEVDIIHARRPHSQLVPGYCFDCQEWLLMFFLLSIAGVVIVLIGIITWDYNTFFAGVVMVGLDFFAPGIISSLTRKKGHEDK